MSEAESYIKSKVSYFTNHEVMDVIPKEDVVSILLNILVRVDENNFEVFKKIVPEREQGKLVGFFVDNKSVTFKTKWGSHVAEVKRDV